MGPDRGDNAASSQLERMSEGEREAAVGMLLVLSSQRVSQSIRLLEL